MEHVCSAWVLRCTFRKIDLCIEVGRVGARLIAEGPAPPPPSHSGEGKRGDCNVPHVVQENQSHPVALSNARWWMWSNAWSQHGIRPSLQRRGKGEFDWLRCLLSALPSAPGTAGSYSGHRTGLVEKLQRGANPRWLEFFGTIFSPFGEKRGCYWLLLVEKHVIQSVMAFGSTGPQQHVIPCNIHSSLLLTSQAIFSLIFLIHCMLHKTPNKKKKKTRCIPKFRSTMPHADQSGTAWDWKIRSAAQQDLTHKSMISLAQLLFCNIRPDINKERVCWHREGLSCGSAN